MPRDIGPEMLANLDAKLAVGELTQHEYDAKRVEVLELIRRGKAVDIHPARRAIAITCSVLLIVAGAVLLLTMKPLTVLLGLAMIVAAIFGLKSSV